MTKEILDRVKLGIVALYVIQAEGRPSIDEIKETVSKMGVKVTKKQISDVVEASRKRGLISVNYDRDEKDNTITRYSMKDQRWTNPPELAHSKAILPKILSTPEAETFRKQLDDTHEDGEVKSKRGPNIRDYVTATVKFTNVVKILGGHPDGERMLKLRRNNGCVWLPLNAWFKGAIRDRLRMVNETGSKAMYVDIADLFVPEKDLPLTQISLPSPPPRPGAAGTGFTNHEAIKEGWEFETRIKFPTTGFCPKDRFFNEVLEGMRIGAKHKDFGLLHILKVEEV